VNYLRKDVEPADNKVSVVIEKYNAMVNDINVSQFLSDYYYISLFHVHKTPALILSSVMS